jgi:hypothetical protein
VCGLSRALNTELGDDLDCYEALDAAKGATHGLVVAPRRSVALGPDRQAPARSRQFALDTCTEWGLPKYGNVAELLASELVTNAVVHARTPMEVTMHRFDTSIGLSVRDGDPRPMHRPEPDGNLAAEHGRGLLMLDAMADAWGCNPTVDGKVVWARINLR